MARGEDGCTCDYSYICPQCRMKIELENKLDYERERIEWVMSSIKKIAEKLKIELDEEPKMRDVRNW